MPDHPHEHIPSVVRELERVRDIIEGGARDDYNDGDMSRLEYDAVMEIAQDIDFRIGKLEAQANEADDE